MDGERTRTLLFGLFLVAGREELTTPDIVALAAPLGLTATNVRSHLTRLVARGDLVRRGGPRRARYRPSPRKEKAVAGIRFRLDFGATEKWDGRWVLLSIRPPSSRRERAALARRLRFDGFAPRGGGTHLRPLWPRRRVTERAAAYVSARNGIALCGLLLGVDPLDEARRRFRTHELKRAAARVEALFTKHRRRIRSAEDALALRLRLGGLVARTMATDPVLPAELWGGVDPMRRLATQYRRFEAHLVGRSAPAVTRALREGAARAAVLGRPLLV